MCDTTNEITAECSFIVKLEVPLSIGKEVNRIAKLIRLKNKNRSSYIIKITEKEDHDYEEVNINSVECLDVGFIGNK